jgi:pilus assembly protein CpaE
MAINGATLMSDGLSVFVKSKSRIILFSDDAEFVQPLQAAFDASAITGFTILECGLNSQAAEREISDAAILIVDLRASEQDYILELQQLMARIGDVPVIVIIDALTETAARKLVQMRVADILVKPVAPIELLRACTTLACSKSEESQIYTFLPAAGGVGTTTLAIQSALALLGAGTRGSLSTCLVDLNLHKGACADYLDIEARLKLEEIELKPERLDRQLLEGMLSRLPNGLAVIAAPNLPTEPSSVASNIVMRLLNIVCQCFDQVVIDMPNAWHSWTDHIVLGSNKLFLVSEATVPGVRKAKQLAKNISARLGQRPHPNVIVNRFEQRLFSSGLRSADFANTLGDYFAGTVPYNRKLVREAIDRGVPLGEIQKHSDVAAAVKRLIIPRRAKLNLLSQSLGRLPTLPWPILGRA